jgi:K+-transporting ATPase KdpF subunit
MLSLSISKDLKIVFPQPAKGVAMDVMYVLGAVLSVGMLVYLMIALLKAEWF